MSDEPASEDGSVGEARRVPLHRNLFVWAFLVGIVTLTALRPLLRHIPDPPPVVGEVPPFNLIDQEGRPFGRNDLLGRVTIANRLCGECASANPDVMKGMRRIGEAYKDRGIDRIDFLSISTDPADTPQRLRDYARANGVAAVRWTFLTGDAAAVSNLAAHLFTDAPPIDAGAKSPQARPPDAADTGTKPLVLIDQRGRIRGWYAADEMGLDEVYNRAQHVLAQPARDP